ncbi:glycoside hydrolase domain-containing protein [Kitasatospora sp. NPDC091207]|uniref:glycoside hydrolase domain-containing protein n=1 Tax=Kitasatospora sp. NPDC091207 TaxID=3364083 RepID=UPI0038283BF0
MRLAVLARALVGALVLSSAGLAVTGPAAASPDDGRTVTYRGTTLRVPASWPVIDLDAAPDTCVRFDRHAVYLGRPGADQACPSHLRGRSEAILLQPAVAGAEGGVRENTASREITVTTGTVTVTAAYGGDRAAVTTVLDRAGLRTTSGAAAQGTAAPRVSAAAPAVSTAVSAAVSTAALAAAVDGSTTNYTGQGFDPCAAPSSATMRTWMDSSPYGAIGIYIGGVNRTCDQPNLTADWVARQASIDWHFFPLYVGHQAPGACPGCATIPSAAQGVADADDAIARLTDLGFPPGTPVYMDNEHYAPQYSGLVLGYLSAWTTRLHARGYLSGVYGSAGSTISDLVANYSSYAMPDVIDFAAWPGSGGTSTSDPAIPDQLWADHQRIHQYTGGRDETYGGITINIDADYLDVRLAAAAGRGWDDFGDGRQNPAIGREANGAMIAFAVSPDQQGLYYREQTAPNSGWGSWQRLGGPVGGLPVVGRNPDGRLELFVLGPGRSSIQHIWQTAPNGGWSSWDPSFGGASSGVTVGQNADGRLEVFAVAPDRSSISHIWQTAPNGGWSGWNADGGGPFGGPTGGAPVVGHEADGRMAVFVLAPNGSGVAIREQTAPSSGWGAWNGSFGGASSDVTVGQNADGRLEVFAVAPDRSSISHIWQTAPNGGWSGWNADGGGPFGGPTGGAPVVGHEADGRMAVFVLAPNGGGVAIREQTAPSSGWGAWNGSFGGAAATVNVSHNADGRMEVFALAPGGANISHIWQSAPNGGWSGWNADGTFGGAAWVGP